MGTRGLIGIYSNQVTKATYNHWDSYPEGLGVSILEETKDAMRDIGIDKLKERVAKIQMIEDSENEPSKELVKRYKKFSNAQVGGPVSNVEVKTWYQLLRELQGTLTPYFKGEVEHMIDSLKFIQDSLFCEWVYIVNLDDGLLEVYNGFITKPHNQGRYANLEGRKSSDTEYYPCRLIKTYPLDNLPSEEKFLEEIKVVMDNA